MSRVSYHLLMPQSDGKRLNRIFYRHAAIGVTISLALTLIHEYVFEFPFLSEGAIIVAVMIAVLRSAVQAAYQAGRERNG